MMAAQPHLLHCQAIWQLLTLPLKLASTMKFNRANSLRPGWRSTDNCRPSLLCGAWLIKWVVKREIIQLTELCLTRWWIISGTWWYWVSIWRYWLVLGQYKLVLLAIRWYMVSKGLVCLYILEKVEIWSGVTDASHTHRQTDRQQKIGLLSFSTVSSLSWVTQ